MRTRTPGGLRFRLSRFPPCSRAAAAAREAMAGVPVLAAVAPRRAAAVSPLRQPGGGSAIGVAVAYRDRDAEALASYGFTLEELDALSPRMRCARILDVAIGQAGHPDEQAMREASVAHVKTLVSGAAETAGVSPLESVRTSSAS